jgi:hypothetical protein
MQLVPLAGAFAAAVWFGRVRRRVAHGGTGHAVPAA